MKRIKKEKVPARHEIYKQRHRRPGRSHPIHRPGSVQRIERGFACRIEYHPDKALLIAGGTRLERGQYAVLAMCSIVAMDQAVFDERHEKDEVQKELFEEAF